MPYFSTQGIRLHYRQQGQGPLLVILPGNTASSTSHMGELEYFGQRFHAVALDFMGTGGSQRLERWPADWFDQSAHHTAHLVEHLGQPSAILMGTSGGALVALLVGIYHPDLARAILADSTVEHLTGEHLRLQENNRMPILERHDPDETRFWALAHGADWEAVVRADTAMLLALADEGRTSLFAGRLKEITCPVLFTASLQDDGLPHASSVGAQICAMVEQIPGSQAYFTREGGHPLMWSQPERFRQQADLFLASLASRSG